MQVYIKPTRLLRFRDNFAGSGTFDKKDNCVPVRAKKKRGEKYCCPRAGYNKERESASNKKKRRAERVIWRTFGCEYSRAEILHKKRPRSRAYDHRMIREFIGAEMLFPYARSLLFFFAYRRLCLSRTFSRALISALCSELFNRGRAVLRGALL